MDVNEAPEFTEGETATREVAENTVADTNIGAPVTAMDEDSGDTLMYAFDDSTDDDSRFVCHCANHWAVENPGSTGL